MGETHRDWKFKGRGAVGNPTGRFEPAAVVPFDDGWGSLDQDEPEALETFLHPETSRTIISHNNSPDIPFNQSINPYQGCEHGCIYCYARPSHAYYNLSPGLDFETHIFYKPEAAALLDQELRKPNYKVDPISIGANTDPYQPVERQLGITRQIIQKLGEFRHPFTLITKNHGVVRDIDLLAPLAAQGLCQAFVSITTLRADLARKMEPRASSPRRRLQALATLSQAGIPTGIMTAPMILGLNDPELEDLLEAGAQAGVQTAGYILVRLPHELKELFLPWLREHYPDALPRVVARIRDTREGQLNNSEFGQRMKGTGEFADLLRARFNLACRRLGLNQQRTELNCSLFSPPPRPGDQLSLFAKK